MAESILNCTKCKNFGCSNPIGPFIQVGKGRGKEILIIAESPAKNGWRISGKACHNEKGSLLATGKRLNEYLALFDLNIKEVSFTEMAKCFIPNRKHLEKCMRNCKNNLSVQIEQINPKLVITVGVITNKVFSELFEKEMPIGKVYLLNNFTYFPLYHPSPANPQGHKKNLEIIKKLYLQLKYL